MPLATPSSWQTHSEDRDEGCTESDDPGAGAHRRSPAHPFGGGERPPRLRRWLPRLFTGLRPRGLLARLRARLYGKGYGHRYYRGRGNGYYARPYRYYRPYGRGYYAPPPYYSPYPQPYYYGYGPGYYAPPPPVYGNPRFGIGLFFGF